MEYADFARARDRAAIEAAQSEERGVFVRDTAPGARVESGEACGIDQKSEWREIDFAVGL